MAQVTVRLLGRFELCGASRERCDLGSHKGEELFAFLVLRRGRPSGRERLADLLWEEGSPQTRKYLRQALWQINRALAAAGVGELLHADHEYVHLALEPFTVDVFTLERLYHSTQGRLGRDFEGKSAAAAEACVLACEGDLLDGWPGSWILQERERCRLMVLTLAEKLCDYYEGAGNNDASLGWGERVLTMDPAQERVHRRMMRVLYRSGDRTGALRQFQRCTSALERELGVRPSSRTIALWERIRSERRTQTSASVATTPREADAKLAQSPLLSPSIPSAGEALTRLLAFPDRLESMLDDLREIARALRGNPPG